MLPFLLLLLLLLLLLSVNKPIKWNKIESNRIKIIELSLNKPIKWNKSKPTNQNNWIPWKTYRSCRPVTSWRRLCRGLRARNPGWPRRCCGWLTRASWGWRPPSSIYTTLQQYVNIIQTTKVSAHVETSGWSKVVLNSVISLQQRHLMLNQWQRSITRSVYNTGSCLGSAL